MTQSLPYDNPEVVKAAEAAAAVVRALADLVGHNVKVGVINADQVFVSDRVTINLGGFGYRDGLGISASVSEALICAAIDGGHVRALAEAA